MHARSNTSLAIFALVGIVIIWSYNWVVMKSVLDYIGPFEFSAMRCLMGSMLLFLLLALLRKPMSPPPLAPTMLIGLLQTAGMTGVAQLALVTGGAGNTAVLVYTLPFWMIILAALVLGEKITRTKLMAIAVAAVGLLLVMQPWQGGGTLLSSFFAVLSGFLWASGSIVTKKLYNTGVKVDLLNLTAWQMLFGSIILLPVAVFTHETPIVWSNYLIFALAYNALPAAAVAWALWLFVLRVLPTAISGLSMLLVPVVSVLLAWAILDEAPNGTALCGIACIVAALVLTTGAASTLKGVLAGKTARTGSRESQSEL